jgi:hypothetical protein
MGRHPPSVMSSIPTHSISSHERSQTSQLIIENASCNDATTTNTSNYQSNINSLIQEQIPQAKPTVTGTVNQQTTTITIPSSPQNISNTNNTSISSGNEINTNQKVNIKSNSFSDNYSHLSPSEPNTPNHIINPHPTSSISLHSTHININSNLPMGSLITTKPVDSIRLYFNNINGARPYHDWTRRKAANHQLAELHVDIFGAADTNLDWSFQSCQIARTTCQLFFKNAVISTSSSSDHGKSDFQPGGTITAITGKWTGRCSHSIADKSGMGRWSGYMLQKANQKYVHIMTAYRPVSASNTGDSHTFYQQNWNIIRNTGNDNPDPPNNSFLTSVQKSCTYIPRAMTSSS